MKLSSLVNLKPLDVLYESTESKWNAIDVSRKAEKEIDNKEWNERTAKKLEMLKTLNSAGKFKKDWDEEKLQGWVDQNYSWEKLARQFKLKENKIMKLKEAYSAMYEADPEYTKDPNYRGFNPKHDSPMPFRDNPDANDQWSKDKIAQDSATIKKVINLKMDSEIGEPVTVEYDPKKNLRDVTISWGNESHTVDFEVEGTIDDHGNEGLDLETIANSDDGRWQFILDVYAEATYPMTGDFAEWDFDELIVQGHPDNEDHLEPEDRSDQDPMEEGLEDQALQVTAPNGTVAMITDPRDIGDFITGKGIIYGETQDGGVIELHIDSALDYQYVANEGSCGYSQEAPGGKDLKTPGGTKGMPADKRTITMMREVIRKEIRSLKNSH